MAKAEKYNGRWLLIPELSIYQRGEPPLSGLYVISTESDKVNFTIQWTDASNSSHTLEFGGQANGEKQASNTPGVSHVSYEKIDNLILDSTAYDGERKLLYARRAASKDGGILSVVQVIYADDEAYSNFQVYKRESS